MVSNAIGVLLILLILVASLWLATRLFPSAEPTPCPPERCATRGIGPRES